MLRLSPLPPDRVRDHTWAKVRVITIEIGPLTYRVVVPPGGWKKGSSITAEEWASGLAGLEIAKGMYG